MNTNFNIEKISKKFKIPETIVSYLFSLGYDNEKKLAEYLYSDIDSIDSRSIFNNIDQVVDRVKFHINNNSKILIYGDYDCDGIVSSAILYLAFKKYCNQVSVYIPSRNEDGYGLNLDVANRIIADSKPDLLITVDCGITSVEEISFLQNNGVEVIVTDHHVPKEDLPNCLILNPHLEKYQTPLCGAGVAYILVDNLFGKSESIKYIDICAIATIADLVPLTNLNRIIAKEGLKKLSQFSKRPGIASLCDIIKIKDPNNISSSDISFKIAPMLNAAGRLSSAKKAFDLLISEDKRYSMILAKELFLENEERKHITKVVEDIAKNMLIDYDLSHNKVIVLFNEWEAGVLGIAAHKIADEFNRPTILLTENDGVIKGSCRSIPGIDILELLDSSSSFLSNFGGHKMAAGLSLPKENLDSFRFQINKMADEKYSTKDFIVNNTFDIMLDYNKVTLDYAKKLKLLEPFGIANTKPIFLFKTKSINFEQIKTSQHLKLKHKYLNIVAFNMLDYIDLFNSNNEKKLYYYININNYKNIESAEIVIKDIEFVDFNLNDEMLIIESLKRYVVSTNKTNQRKKYFNSNASFGEINLCYSNETFNKLTKKYPDYRKAIIKLHNSDVINTIILSPDINQNFDYYNKIVVHDNPPSVFINSLIEKYGDIILVGAEDNLPHHLLNTINIDRKYIDSIYLAIKSSIYIEERTISLFLKKLLNSNDILKAYIAILILLEIKVIKFENKSISLTPIKSSLSKSKIFDLFSKTF